MQGGEVGGHEPDGRAVRRRGGQQLVALGRSIGVENLDRLPKLALQGSRENAAGNAGPAAAGRRHDQRRSASGGRLGQQADARRVSASCDTGRARKREE
jgi:hypothetical protein